VRQSLVGDTGSFTKSQKEAAMSVPKGAAPSRRPATTSKATDSDARQSVPRTANVHLVNTESVAPGLIGARLRARRLARGISLRQFARDLEVSASFISQLETGKAQPSVATLFAICAALDIGTDELFASEVAHVEPGSGATPEEGTDARNNSWRSESSFGVLPTTAPAGHGGGEASLSAPVVHPFERKVLVLDSGVTWESLTATRNDKTDFMFVRYDVGGSSTMEGRLIRHVGTEYGFIISGTLEITLGFDTYRLTAGDSISFDSSRPHRLANVGDIPVEAIWVNLEAFGPSH
jgi:transcriptional regulator with XRE-family HTH domain/mannose-6-phosphate isomerase-like protein (cupin superfamily)